MNNLDKKVANLLSSGSVILSRSGGLYIARMSIHCNGGNVAPMGSGATPFGALENLLTEAETLRRVFSKNPVAVEKMESIREVEKVA